jgi:hypothetical protein
MCHTYSMRPLCRHQLLPAASARVGGPPYAPPVTPGLTAELLTPQSTSDRAQRWSVLFEGKPIGRIQSRQIGRSSSRFYEGVVIIDGKSISIELSTDFEERCEKILSAWRDPASNVHAKYALGL